MTHLFVRFSPYICTEWENGGIPSWLLKDRNVRYAVVIRALRQRAGLTTTEL